MASLERPDAPHVWDALRAIRPGNARGVLFGGNLALLCAMATANALVVPEGAIMLVEDVTERPYRVDRMLTSLHEGGHFARASALVFGDFSQCDAGPDGVTIDDVIADRARSLSVPVYASAPFGHGDRNEAFTIGAPAVLENGSLSW
jgi:muramoyltetrapeptide carboxypeptidase